MIIFSTVGGTTRKVAQRVAEHTADRVILDAKTAMSELPSHRPSHLILFCPTYGDEEVEDQFETLLLNHDWSTLADTGFAFCELGVYTGYEDFGYGLAKMVNHILTSHGMFQLAPNLSVDSLPVTDWAMIKSWAEIITTRLNN